MIEWWQNLDGPEKLFWSIAFGATLLQVLLFLLSLVGGDSMDYDPDGEFDTVDGVKLISFRAVIAFLVGFGWTGGILLEQGMGLLPASAIAVVVGGIMMLLIYGIMRAMMALKADGTVDFNNAVGTNGSVYVTIPGKRAGHGQVEIQIQGRITTIQAVTNHTEDLSPQTAIKVESVEPGNLLVVSPR